MGSAYELKGNITPIYNSGVQQEFCLDPVLPSRPGVSELLDRTRGPFGHEVNVSQNMVPHGLYIIEW